MTDSSKKTGKARGALLGTLVAGILIGVVSTGGFIWSMEATNSEAFCIGCHEMEAYVYAEYKGTIHDSNRSGVRATCPDCHVPKDWLHKIARKVKSTNEIYHKIAGSISTPEKYDAKRMELANRVWADMKASDSRECRNCHDLTSMNPEKQTMTAAMTHEAAPGMGMTCIDCHHGIAHQLPAAGTGEGSPPSTP